MKLDNIRDRFSFINTPIFIQTLLLVAAACLAIIALTAPISIRPSSYSLQVGSVSPQDIQAPFELTFESDVLTEQAIKEAEQNISPIYLPADPNITRQQINKLTNVINFISNVRADNYASNEQKIQDIKTIANTNFNEDISLQLLNLSTANWQTVQNEAIRVLEQVMRNTIREDQLIDAQRSVTTLISYHIPQDQAAIVSELVTPFIAPNSLYSKEQTDLARDEAKNSVEAITRTYASGETIIRRGQVITPLAWEALTQFNLIQPNNNNKNFIASIILVMLLSGLLPLYFSKNKDINFTNVRNIIFISGCMIFFLFGARLVIPNRTIIPYLYPLSAFGLTISSLYSIEIGMIFTIILSTLAGHGLPISLELTIYYIFTSFFGMFILGKGRRISHFFASGVAIGLVGSGIIIIYRLPDNTTDWIGIATLIGAAFFNGMASASLTLLFQHFFAQVLGIITPLQMLEISRPDHPLLQSILKNAPGTYQHSLQVANLAERAAEAIGANSLLTRVGSIYHDAGKSINPSYFIENKVSGKTNPHDELDPVTSSSIIIQHVTDGIQLAKKYRIPPRIQDFMREHHGTLITRYQYTKAVQAAGNQPEFVNMELFRYPGPRPQTRETALLMLADGCEARARAELPSDEKELRSLVKQVFDFCQREGQLDDTDFTLQDLNLAIDSMVHTLKSTHHLRIKYPELKPQNQRNGNQKSSSR